MPSRPSRPAPSALNGRPRPPAVFLNRELSWLAFNDRVLQQVSSERHPLLERVRFLSIVSSNLDEFFQIRVAGLMQQMDSGVTEPAGDGLDPAAQLAVIHERVTALVAEQYRCWHDLLVPALAREGICFKTARDLDAAELKWVQNYFRDQVYPVLTPLALDQSHPFPQLGNKTLNIIASLDNPATPEVEQHVAILPVPRILPRLVEIAVGKRGGPRPTMFLSEIIKLCAAQLFPGYRLAAAHAFRVTRNSELYIDEEESENLLKKIEDELRKLRRGAAVRLEIEDGVDPELFGTLCEHLALSQDYVYRINGPVNLLRLQALADLDRPDLKFAPFIPANATPLAQPAHIFDSIRTRDVLLHHPYDSFQPVVDFVEQAARDPQVFAIKQTFYRTSGDSPLVRALIEASRQGKQVTALVELKARFDEANNIQWAKQLEEAGVHVVYGLVGHKTHCKLCLVVRREGRRMRHYAHLGTGNYNPRTARVYTDLSLFTARLGLTRDVAHLFNALTGFGRSPVFRHLLVAPYNLHRRIAALIAREARHAAAGKPARIIVKMNALVDRATIESLYAASGAGVKIDLIIRGVCCLVPGVKGLSENIRVRSLVGRYLEHARAMYFENAGGDPVILAGSADWMPRNFFRRIEAVFPIADAGHRRWFMREFFLSELRDNVNAHLLRADGSYHPVPRRPGAPRFSAHDELMAAAERRTRG